jgi:hypothetical protein
MKCVHVIVALRVDHHDASIVPTGHDSLPEPVVGATLASNPALVSGGAVATPFTRIACVG